MAALTAAAATIAGGVHSVFSYNRENFKYDREMRQRCEFKVLEFRKKQAAMWREDVRDLIGMTENRMDRYLIMTTIQLGMVLGMFTEGRLEAGSPQWLLRFYMLSLGSAFMYLLMSVWLAMHASVVAQTSGTRLLTQFVRLPIPTWQHINKMRTFAASFETLGTNMVRVPFIRSPDAPKSTWNQSGSSAWASAPPGTNPDNFMAPHGTPAVPKPYDKKVTGSFKDRGSRYSQMTSSPSSGSLDSTYRHPSDEDDNHFDVWGLEEDGYGLEELKPKPPADRAHIRHVKDESLHWQCHDLFTRVTMTLGTNHLIFSIIYYCLGYLSIQDGAPMPSWCVAALMLCTAVTLVYLDFIIPPEDMKPAMALIVTGPCCVALTTFLMAARSPNVGTAYMFCLPTAYLAHAGWLFWALQALGVERHSNGAWLPMKFRPMAYLDVFHWYFLNADESELGSSSDASDEEAFAAASTFEGPRPGKAFKLGHRGLGYYHDAVQELQLLNEYSDSQATGHSSAGHQVSPELEEQCLLGGSEARAGPDAAWVKIKGTTDLGAEVPYFYNERTGDIRSQSFDMLSRSRSIEDDVHVTEQSPKTRASSMQSQTSSVTRASSMARVASALKKNKKADKVNVVTDSFHGPATDYGVVEPGFVPWQMLKSATWLLIMLWCAGPLLSFHCVGGPLEYGLAPMQFEDAQEANTDRIIKWNPAQMALSAVAGSTDPGYLPSLENGQEVLARDGMELWPRRNSFTPKSMSCDPSGRQLVVADDFGLYKSSLDFGTAIRGSFSRAPPCTVFEGQLLKDIGVVCLKGNSECRILVLHENGHKISECPLHTSQEDGPIKNLFKNAHQPEAADGAVVGTQAKEASRSNKWVLRGDSRNLMAQSHKAVKSKVTPIVTWKIAAQWLDAKHEQVQSMAVNKFSKDCLGQAAASSQDHQSGQAFLPKGPGCIVVGTTSGRLIGLRRHVTDSHELVPEINMQHRPNSVVQGSLRIMFNGIIVALRRSPRETLEAVDMKSGSKLGEWRLPHGISWITLCCAGRHLFVLGRDVSAKERRIVLWRFPLPAELQTERSMVPHEYDEVYGSAQEM